MEGHPSGRLGRGDPDFDHGYRLARYASYDHWKSTRQGHLLLGGDGPDYHRSREALRARSHYTAGSRGGHFLEGEDRHSERLLHAGARDEAYEVATGAAAEGPHPVRNDVNWPAPEIVALEPPEDREGIGGPDHRRGGRRHLWPYLEKVGAQDRPASGRPSTRTRGGFPESPDFDEGVLHGPPLCGLRALEGCAARPDLLDGAATARTMWPTAER